MLANPPPRVRRRQPNIVVPIVAAPLVLKAASYDPNLLLLLMTFNQPVNTSAAVVTNSR